MKIICCIICLLLDGKIAICDYKPWVPAAGNPKHLICPIDWCNGRYPNNLDDCCVCYAVSSWSPVTILSIEYLRRVGSAVVIGDMKTMSRLVHQNGFLTGLPNNMCNFTNIVEVDFKRNNIMSIENLSCLNILDTLDLSYNVIHHITNDTFTGMTNLRVLKITHNGLMSLDPFTITRESLFIFHADFSFNNFTELDISNIIPENNFCKYDFSSNQIHDFVNNGGFVLSPDKIYKGGYVELIGNNFTEFIKFEDLGIDDISILGKILGFGFSMPDAKFTCNCVMEPFLTLSSEIIERIWRDYFNLTCWNPPEYRGQSIVDIVKEKRLDILICNLTDGHEKCPRKCHCFYQPSKNRTVVDCSYLNFSEMPKYLPNKNNISLILRQNKITFLSNSSYLRDISELDISNNLLRDINNSAIKTFRQELDIDLKRNNLKSIQREFQTFDPCKVKFGNITIQCDCNSLWLRDWLENKRGHRCLNVTNIICQTDQGLISAYELTKDHVCEETNIFNIMASIFGISLSIFMGVSGILYIFRYEIYLMRRKLTFIRSNKILDALKYDAYISFNDDNSHVTHWVIKMLDTQLRLGGYRTFIACRDMIPGLAREKETSYRISQSKNYIVVLCESYLLNEHNWTAIEWKYMWHYFRQNISRNIIVINFDQLEAAMVQNSKLKAFLRLGQDLDFSNQKHRLMKDIKCRLGLPIFHKLRVDINAKPIFYTRQNKVLLKDYFSFNV